jgi:hypothetical protein
MIEDYKLADLQERIDESGRSYLVGHIGDARVLVVEIEKQDEAEGPSHYLMMEMATSADAAGEASC